MLPKGVLVVPGAGGPFQGSRTILEDQEKGRSQSARASEGSVVRDELCVQVKGLGYFRPGGMRA